MVRSGGLSLRAGRNLVALALIAAVAGGCAPAAPAGSPGSSAPAGSSGGSPVVAASRPPATDRPPLPDPALGSATEIVQAIGRPELAEQFVVSLLAELGIGLYKPDGTAIRTGAERSDADFFLFEPEADGLVGLVRSLEDPEASLAFRDFHAGLAGLGYEGTAEELASAYAEAYAASPDSIVSTLVTGTAELSADSRLPTFTAWLLVLDGFVPPSVAASAVAMAGSGPVAAAGRSAWGVAASRVQRRGNLSPQAAQYVARLMAIAATWTVNSIVEPATGHEGHSGDGAPITVKIDIQAYGKTFTSPISGNPVVPITSDGHHSGIGVGWSADAAATKHGSFSAQDSLTDAKGFATATYTPKAEESYGRGTERHDMAGVVAAVSKQDLLRRVYGIWVEPYAAFVPGVIRGKAQFGMAWHEQQSSPIEIAWTEVYGGQQDIFIYSGELKGYDPESVNGQKVYIGTGFVTGGRGAWAACNPGMEDIQRATVEATFTAGLNADGTITISAYANLDTSLVGVSTGSLTVSVDGGLAESIPMPPFGDKCPHHSFGTLTYQGGLPPDVPFTP